MGRKPEGQAEHLFKNLGKKIDELIEDIKKGAQDPKYKDRFEELKKNGEKLKNEFQNFKTDNKAVFDDIEESFERAGKEIKNIFKDFNKK